MPNNINPEIDEIHKRFFDALDVAIDTGKISGLQTFCEEHGLNRVKYSNIRSELRNPEKRNEEKPHRYRSIDVEALMHICKDFNVSAEWLLLGNGKMFK